MEFCLEFLISCDCMVPGIVVGHVGDCGQALQGQLQLVLDIVGPVDGTWNQKVTLNIKKCLSSNLKFCTFEPKNAIMSVVFHTFLSVIRSKSSVCLFVCAYFCSNGTLTFVTQKFILSKFRLW